MVRRRDPAEVAAAQERLSGRVGEMVSQAHGATGQTDVGGGEPSPAPQAPSTPPESHAAEPAPTGASAPEPVPQTDERVPFDRFSDMTRQRDAARQETEAVRQELAQMRAQQAEAQRQRELERITAPENRPAGFEDWSDERQMAYTAQQVFQQMAAQQPQAQAIPGVDPDRLNTILVKDHLRSAFPDTPSEQQLAVMAPIQQANQGLTPQQVRILAQSEHPQLFSVATAETEAPSEGPTGPAIPPSHQVNRPTGVEQRAGPSAPPQGSKAQAAFDQARQSGDKAAMREAFGDLIRNEIVAPAEGIGVRDYNSEGKPRELRKAARVHIKAPPRRRI